MAYSRYQSRQQDSNPAVAFINHVTKLPSGNKLKMESKKLFAHIDGHHEAIAVCEDNHDVTIETDTGITHYWFVQPKSTAPVKTKWGAPEAPAPSEVEVDAVTEEIAQLVEATEEDAPF